jgi:predicted metalloprotease with PDZ domain
LQRGDEIVALDGVRVTGESLQARVLAYGLGDTMRVTLFREGMLTEIPVPLTVALPPAPRIRKSAEAGEEQRALFTSWTGTAW